MVLDGSGNSKMYGDSKRNPQNIFIRTAAFATNFVGGGNPVPLTGIHSVGTGTYPTDGGGGGGGGGGTDPPPPTDPPTGGGGGAYKDKFGVAGRYPFKTVKYDFRENFRSDGKRFDFGGLGNAYASAELIGYFAASSNPNDEVSGKMGGGRHSGDGVRVNTYDMGQSTTTGATRWRMEEIHPRYSSGMSGGKGSPLLSRYVGFSFIHKILPNNNTIEIWNDTGSNDGSTPANDWKMISRWVDTKWNFRSMLSSHQETVRIDGSGGVPSLKWKWLSLRDLGV